MTLVTAAETGALGTLAVIAASTAYAFRRPTQMFVAAGAAVLAAVATAFDEDGVLVGVAVILALAAVGLFARAVRAATTDDASRLLAELQRESTAKGRFLPRTLVDRLGRSSLADVVVGDRATEPMTILFADIRDSTSLTELLPADDAFALVAEFFARSGDVVRRQRGSIDRYLGDGFMALFPRRVEDALDAALALQEAVRELNRQAIAPPIDVGIGIHTGPVTFGTVGDARHIDTTVISDTVNTAKRVEGLSKRLRAPIVASGDVLHAVREPSNYVVQSLGSHVVRGKREPIDVYAVEAGVESRIVSPDRGTRAANPAR